MFYDFLYSRKIYSMQDGDYSKVEGDLWRDGTDGEWRRLLKLWSLGERLLSTSFKDAVVDALISKIKGASYFVDGHEEVYSQSYTWSKIRTLWVDSFIWQWRPGTLENQSHKKRNSEFYFDVVVAMDKIKADGRGKVSPFLGEDTCMYHDHDDEDKPCYKTMF